LNQPAQAVDAARRAVALEPDDTFYRIPLAEALWRTSQRDEALKEARTALAVARNEGERRAAQAEIDSLMARGGIK
jgi:Flp pilus assembly protein TadD